MSTQISVRISDEMLRDIDEMLAGESRQDFIRTAILVTIKAHRAVKILMADSE